MARPKLNDSPTPRPTIVDEPESGGQYFEPEDLHVRRFSSGSTMLDLVLGGGWAMGRTLNIIGDKSTGKTQLAIESAACFHRAFPRARIRYNEAESAFDRPYAQTIGFPPSAELLECTCTTIEQVHEDLKAFGVEVKKSGEPGLYIIDSLDALSDDVEKSSKVTDATYGTGKAKMVSRLFRELNSDLSQQGVTLMILSQIRDNVGAMFGKDTVRSGGRALDFYSSQIVELKHIGRLSKQRMGVERSYGIKVRAQCEKNKAGKPFRKADYFIIWDFGIDNLLSCMTWLLENKQWREAGLTKEEAEKTIADIDKLQQGEYNDIVADLSTVCDRVWKKIEEEFTPTRKKY